MIDAVAYPSASLDARLAVGIDVGGTKIAAGLVNLHDGTIAFRRQVPCDAERGGMAVLRDTCRLLDDLLASAAVHGLRPVGAGVGVAELVDHDGQVFSENRIAWRGLDVQESLSRRLPTRLQADVRAAAVGEARFGAGVAFQDFLFVSVGTGISATLVQRGQPYAGTRGAALIVASGPTRCRCPQCGAETSYVLEDFASGPALVSRFNQITGESAANAQAVLAAAQGGEPAARDIVDTAARALGGRIGLLVNSLDPAAVIVGGGLGSAPGRYWTQLQFAIADHLWKGYPRTLPILQAALGADAGIVGAAAVAGDLAGNPQTTANRNHRHLSSS